MDLIVKNKPRVVDPIWANIANEFAKISFKFPTFSAQRKHLADGTPGEWIFIGPELAVKAFKDLAVTAAERAGFKGTRELLVQAWLDHINGDHIIRKTPKLRRDEDRVAVVLDSQGNRVGYRGRQKVAY